MASSFAYPDRKRTQRTRKPICRNRVESAGGGDKTREAVPGSCATRRDGPGAAGASFERNSVGRICGHSRGGVNSALGVLNRLITASKVTFFTNGTTAQSGRECVRNPCR